MSILLVLLMFVGLSVKEVYYDANSKRNYSLSAIAASVGILILLIGAGLKIAHLS